MAVEENNNEINLDGLDLSSFQSQPASQDSIDLSGLDLSAFGGEPSSEQADFQGVGPVKDKKPETIYSSSGSMLEKLSGAEPVKEPFSLLRPTSQSESPSKSSSPESLDARGRVLPKPKPARQPNNDILLGMVREQVLSGNPIFNTEAGRESYVNRLGQKGYDREAIREVVAVGSAMAPQYNQAKAAVQENPNNFEAQYALGEIALATRDYKSAESAFSKVANSDNEEMALMGAKQMGRVALMKKDGQAAFSIYQNLSQAFPDDPEITMGLSSALETMGDRAGAQEYKKKLDYQALPESQPVNYYEAQKAVDMGKMSQEQFDAMYKQTSPFMTGAGAGPATTIATPESERIKSIAAGIENFGKMAIPYASMPDLTTGTIESAQGVFEGAKQIYEGETAAEKAHGALNTVINLGHTVMGAMMAAGSMGGSLASPSISTIAKTYGFVYGPQALTAATGSELPTQLAFEPITTISKGTMDFVNNNIPYLRDEFAKRGIEVPEDDQTFTRQIMSLGDIIGSLAIIGGVEKKAADLYTKVKSPATGRKRQALQELGEALDWAVDNTDLSTVKEIASGAQNRIDLKPIVEQGEQNAKSAANAPLYPEPTDVDVMEIPADATPEKVQQIKSIEPDTPLDQIPMNTAVEYQGMGGFLNRDTETGEYVFTSGDGKEYVISGGGNLGTPESLGVTVMEGYYKDKHGEYYVRRNGDGYMVYRIGADNSLTPAYVGDKANMQRRDAIINKALDPERVGSRDYTQSLRDKAAQLENAMVQAKAQNRPVAAALEKKLDEVNRKIADMEQEDAAIDAVNSAKDVAVKDIDEQIKAVDEDLAGEIPDEVKPELLQEKQKLEAVKDEIKGQDVPAEVPGEAITTTAEAKIEPTAEMPEVRTINADELAKNPKALESDPGLDTRGFHNSFIPLETDVKTLKNLGFKDLKVGDKINYQTGDEFLTHVVHRINGDLKNPKTKVELLAIDENGNLKREIDIISPEQDQANQISASKAASDEGESQGPWRKKLYAYEREKPVSDIKSKEISRTEYTDSKGNVYQVRLYEDNQGELWEYNANRKAWMLLERPLRGADEYLTKDHIEYVAGEKLQPKEIDLTAEAPTEPVKKWSVSELEERDAVEVMQALGSLKPELKPLMDEAIDVHNKLIEIDNKGGRETRIKLSGTQGYEFEILPKQKNFVSILPFPYRIYSQLFNSTRKGRLEKADQAIEDFKVNLENAKKYLENPPSKQELAAKKKAVEDFYEKKIAEIKKTQSEAKRRVEAAKFDKELAKEYYKTFPFVRDGSFLSNAEKGTYFFEYTYRGKEILTKDQIEQVKKWAESKGLEFIGETKEELRDTIDFKVKEEKDLATEKPVEEVKAEAPIEEAPAETPIEEVVPEFTQEEIDRAYDERMRELEKISGRAGYLEQIIHDNFAGIRMQDWERWGDPNWLKGDSKYRAKFKRDYINEKALPLDLQAISLESESGLAIEPQDVINYIMDREATKGQGKYRKGRKEVTEFNEAKKAKVKEDFEETVNRLLDENNVNSVEDVESLRGFPLSDAEADVLVEYFKNKENEKAAKDIETGAEEISRETIGQEGDGILPAERATEQGAAMEREPGVQGDEAGAEAPQAEVPFGEQAAAKGEIKPVEEKGIKFSRSEEEIKKAQKDLDDLLSGLDLSPEMGGLKNVDKLVPIVAKIVQLGYYKISDVAKYLVEKGLNAALPYLKDAYRQFKSTFDMDTEVKTSLSSDGEIEAFNIGEKPKAVAASRRPPIRIANKESLPSITKETVAEGKYEIDETQRYGVNLALQRFDQGGRGFLLADGAGVGKTREILAITKEMSDKTGKPSLIVTLKAVIDDSIKKDSKALGMDMKNIEVGTYDDLRTGKIGKGDYGVVVFDESHNIKNIFSERAAAAKRVKRDHTVFASATPMDKPEHAVYFMSELTGEDPKAIENELGIQIDYLPNKYNPEEPRPVPRFIAGFDTYIARLIDKRNKIIGDGGMVRREYPFFGDVKETSLPMPKPVEADIMEIKKVFANRYENRKQIVIGRMAAEMTRTQGGNWSQNYQKLDRLIANSEPWRNTYKQKLGEFLKNEAKEKLESIDKLVEPAKVDYVFDETKKALAEGKKVVVVVSDVGKQQIEVGSEKSKNGFFKKTVEETLPVLLKKKFEEAGIKSAEIYGGNKKTGTRNKYEIEMERFNQGDADVVVMTAKSGGTGINLDDVVGDKPRKMIIATVDYQGDVFEQTLGRVSRRNTASPAEVIMPMMEGADSDLNRKSKVAKKVGVLAAINSGRTDIDYERISTQHLMAEEDAAGARDQVKADEPLMQGEPGRVATRQASSGDIKLYSGSRRLGISTVSEANKNYKNMLEVDGDIVSYVIDQAANGDDAAMAILQKNPTELYRAANQYVFDKFGEQYDAVKFTNKGRDGGNPGPEYFDMKERKFLSESKAHAKLYSTANRSKGSEAFALQETKQAKDKTQLTKIYEDVFGLDKEKAGAAAEITDLVVGEYARRQEISKDEAYTILNWKKASLYDIAMLGRRASALYQEARSGVDPLSVETSTKLPDGRVVTTKEMMPEVVDGFYSPIEKRLTEFKQDNASAQKWKSIIGSGDEAVYTGVKQFLESKAPNEQVSKSEIMKFMKDNRIKIETVVKGKGEIYNVIRRDMEKRELVAEDDGYGNIEIRKAGEEVSYDDLSKEDQQLLDSYSNYFVYDMDASQSKYGTKYEEYSVAGERDADSYRELLITKPGDELYTGAHWNEPNVLVHIRYDKRTDANGNKTLFINEIQSDWGQEGRKKGFIDPNREAKIQKLREEIQGLMPEYTKASASYTEYFLKNKKRVEWASDLQKRDPEFAKMSRELLDLEEEYQDKLKQIDDLTFVGKKVGQAPFVTDTNSWTKLAVKNLIKTAVEEGVESISIANGEQVSDSQGISKVVNTVSAIKSREGDKYNIVMEDKYGELDEFRGSGKALTPSQLADYIGKEPARKLIEKADLKAEKPYAEREWAEISGDDLKVSTKNMKSYYGDARDNTTGILGKVAESVVKELTGKDAKLEKRDVVIRSEQESKFFIEQMGDEYVVYDRNTDVPASKKVHDNIFDAEAELENLRNKFDLPAETSEQLAIKITPELKAAVDRGMPLFQETAKGYKGSMEWIPNGKAVITALTDPNVSTPLHEVAHVFEKALTAQERSIISDWSKATQGTRAWSEAFATGFEKYLAEGKAPSADLQSVFSKFKSWLMDIYNKIIGTPLEKQLTEPMRKVYDAMIGFREGEKPFEMPAREVSYAESFRKAGEARMAERSKIFDSQFGDMGEKAKYIYQNYTKILQNLNKAKLKDGLDIDFKGDCI